ncbi:flagellar basal body-associated FliL family protein [Roseivivax isoporae]|uniref:Flagellar protein FliL n=1 Tax=Roseivivax isoporae LMG 25204 TaxID=1449351 RepID=X7F849_9RHOB|nr:flagellar basal body-associated FliL family protein [Roseivivax isoporae]ETX28908.1 hypothetical protein RISW2_04135 [Roseivivax isoporae LMG 25204]
MADEEKPKRPLKRRVLIAAALLAFCAVAGAGGMAIAMGPQSFLALVMGTPADAEAAEAPGETGGPAEGSREHVKAGEVTIVPLDEMIVNITAITLTGRKTTRFLKLDLALVVDPGRDGADRVADRGLFLRDTIQDYLRQLTEDDLDGSAGLALLKAEILRRARAVTESDAPREVLIADMVIQ